MERTTDKHSPRIDEALEHDVQSLVRGQAGESRAQEHRLQEVDVERPDDPIDQRAELAAALAPASWPATRDELVRTARDGHAPDHLLADLERLPHGDTAYEHLESVWEALGGANDGAHTG